MALYNEILTGRHNRLLQKLFGIKGEAPSAQLGGEIMPVLPIMHGAENRYIESWNRFFMVFSRIAVAAQTGKGQIRNPKSSGVIAVVEKMFWTSNLVDSPNAYLNNLGTDLAVVSTAGSGSLDNRGSGSTGLLSSLIISQETSVGGIPAGSVGFWTSNSSANTTLDLIACEDQEIPISPGGTIGMAGGIVNQNFVVGIWWRERVLEESERS